MSGPLRAAHARALRQGHLPHRNQPLACRILTAYSQLGRPNNAAHVFLQLPSPDLVSWASFMNHHLRHRNPGPAAASFPRILASGLRPDGFVAVAAISASPDLPFIASLHASARRRGLDREPAVCNSLIHAYGRVDAVSDARKVFDEMPARDDISWGSLLNVYARRDDTLHLACQVFDEMPRRNSVACIVMITGFVRAGRPLRALELFREMDTGRCPEAVSAALAACADAGALEAGRCLHGLVCKMAVDEMIYNGLIDMYAKAGRPETAAEVFRGRRFRDVYAWTTMISGLAVNGDGDGAVRVFRGMLRDGVVPNSVTFVSVLLACAHAGLVDEGLAWFEAMGRDYGIEPRIEHYGCLIDLLGRAGRLAEAEEVIADMKVEPDGIIWRSLLSACMVHGDRRLTETAARRVIDLEPDDDGGRVLLWNLYAEEGRWDDAGGIRETMRSRGIRKRPGKSWVEVNGCLYEFLVDDDGPLSGGESELHFVLEGLEKHLRAQHHHISEMLPWQER